VGRGRRVGNHKLLASAPRAAMNSSGGFRSGKKQFASEGSIFIHHEISCEKTKKSKGRWNELLGRKWKSPAQLFACDGDRYEAAPWASHHRRRKETGGKRTFGKSRTANSPLNHGERNTERRPNRWRNRHAQQKGKLLRRKEKVSQPRGSAKETESLPLMFPSVIKNRIKIIR